MAVVVEGSGTQALTVGGAEHVVDTAITEGVYVFTVDLAAMLAGDVVELRVKKPVLAAGTARVYLYAMFAGVQPTDDVLKTSLPVVVDAAAGSATFTIRQLLGTSRSVPWSVLRL